MFVRIQDNTGRPGFAAKRMHFTDATGSGFSPQAPHIAVCKGGDVAQVDTVRLDEANKRNIEEPRDNKQAKGRTGWHSVSLLIGVKSRASDSPFAIPNLAAAQPSARADESATANTGQTSGSLLQAHFPSPNIDLSPSSNPTPLSSTDSSSGATSNNDATSPESGVEYDDATSSDSGVEYDETTSSESGLEYDAATEGTRARGDVPRLPTVRLHCVHLP